MSLSIGPKRYVEVAAGAACGVLLFDFISNVLSQQRNLFPWVGIDYSEQLAEMDLLQSHGPLPEYFR